MGNKRSRDLTRPKERGQSCVCDVFDLTAACEAGALVLSLSTDLPVGTRVAVAAHRLLRESDRRQWHWTCLEDVVPVTRQPHGLNGFVLHATRDDLDGKGLHMYRRLQRAMSVVIAAVPSTSLEVSASAPADSHRFGLCNRRLKGKAVTVRPSGHSLERSVPIAVPTSETVMRQLGFEVGLAEPGAAEGGGG